MPCGAVGFESRTFEKCVCGRGSAPDPAGGANSVPHTPWLDLGEGLGKERMERGMEKRKGSGNGEEKKGRVWKGEERDRKG